MLFLSPRNMGIVLRWLSDDPSTPDTTSLRWALSSPFTLYNCDVLHMGLNGVRPSLRMILVSAFYVSCDAPITKWYRWTRGHRRLRHRGIIVGDSELWLHVTQQEETFLVCGWCRCDHMGESWPAGLYGLRHISRPWPVSISTRGRWVIIDVALQLHWSINRSFPRYVELCSLICPWRIPERITEDVVSQFCAFE